MHQSIFFENQTLTTILTVFPVARRCSSFQASLSNSERNSFGVDCHLFTFLRSNECLELLLELNRCWLCFHKRRLSQQFFLNFSRQVVPLIDDGHAKANCQMLFFFVETWYTCAN